MAAKRSNTRKRFAFRFELGLGGLAGLITICFCVFLWMFLLGLWAGQTVLLPSAREDTARAMEHFSSKIWARSQGDLNRPAKVASAAGSSVDRGDDEEPSFFTLQVAAFDSAGHARQEVLDWQAKGEEAFFLESRDGTGHFRVFVGRFDSLAAANEKVDQFEEEEHMEAFITLLPLAGGG